MPTGRRGTLTKNTGLSIEPDLLDWAKKEAKRRKMSVSAYVSLKLDEDRQAEKAEKKTARTGVSVEERLSALEQRVAEQPGKYGTKP